MKYKRLVRDTGIFALGSAGTKLVLFFLVPLYTHFMSDAEYGIADLVVTVSQLIIPFASLSIFDGVLRFGLAKGFRTCDTLLSGLIVSSIGSVAVLLLTPALVLYPAISEWRWLLSAYVVASLFNNLFMNYLKVKDRNRTYAVLSILQTLALATLNIVLLGFYHWGIAGYLLSLVASCGANSLFALVLSGALTDLKTATIRKGMTKQILAYSSPLVLNSISWWVIQSSDKIMIDAMVGAAALGIFTVASKIPAMINVIISIFSQAWGLSSIREYESDNDTRFYSNVLNIYQAIAFGAAIVLTAIVKPFMAIYVGEAFAASWQFVPLLLASSAFSAIASYYGSLYLALRKSLNNMWTTIAAALVNLITNYFGIMLFGIWGAAIGTMVSFALLFIIRLIDVGRYLKIELNKSILAANILIMLAEVGFVSLDYCGPLASALAIATFAAVNGRLLLRRKR